LQEAKIDKLIASPPRLYFLYKSNLLRLGDVYLIGAEAKPSDIGGIIECGASGSFRENERLTEAYLPPVDLFAHASIHYTPHFLGHRVTRHEWGWSYDQYLAEQYRYAAHSNKVSVKTELSWRWREERRAVTRSKNFAECIDNADARMIRSIRWQSVSTPPLAI
jgi:hypothetical protein